jgi:hypothetical protein
MFLMSFHLYLFGFFLLLPHSAELLRSNAAIIAGHGKVVGPGQDNCHIRAWVLEVDTLEVWRWIARNVVIFCIHFGMFICEWSSNKHGYKSLGQMWPLSQPQNSQ